MERLEVVKIDSAVMRKDQRKRKYLRMVKEIKEAKGPRSARMGEILNSHKKNKERLVQKYLSKIE